jgi:hypothetical protein
MLTEGSSIRAIGRITGVHRDIIGKGSPIAFPQAMLWVVRARALARAAGYRFAHTRRSRAWPREDSERCDSGWHSRPSSAGFQPAVSQCFQPASRTIPTVPGSTLTACRLEIGDTAGWKPALLHVADIPPGFLTLTRMRFAGGSVPEGRCAGGEVSFVLTT